VGEHGEKLVLALVGLYQCLLGLFESGDVWVVPNPPSNRLYQFQFGARARISPRRSDPPVLDIVRRTRNASRHAVDVLPVIRMNDEKGLGQGGAEDTVDAVTLIGPVRALRRC
jgi:hypothetical protein